MDFEELYKRISPRLRQMAKRQYYGSLSFDEGDLYQEMCMHLWNNFKDGVPEGITENYIVNGCRFHILNYIRRHREKTAILSMEGQAGANGEILADILPAKNEPSDRYAERNIVFDYVKNNGFSKREKDVVSLLLEGYTVRQAGEKLGISHVMVVKYKKRIIRKWQKKNNCGYQH